MGVAYLPPATEVATEILPCRALGTAKEKNSALDALARYIVWGSWERKSKFRVPWHDRCAGLRFYVAATMTGHL